MSSTPWSCSQCTYRNRPGSTSCEVCQNPRHSHSASGGTGTAADFRPTTAAATTDMPFSLALDNPPPTRPPVITSAPTTAATPTSFSGFNSSAVGGTPNRITTTKITTYRPPSTTATSMMPGNDKLEALLEEQGARVKVKNHPHQLHHVTSVRSWYCDFCRSMGNEWNPRHRCTTCKDTDACQNCINSGKTRSHGHRFKLVSFGRDHAKQKASWYCDECKKVNNGFRYRCEDCHDFDMCKDCVRRNADMKPSTPPVFASATILPSSSAQPIPSAPAEEEDIPVSAAAVPGPYVPATSAQPYLPSTSAQPYVPSEPYVPGSTDTITNLYVPTSADSSTNPYVPPAPTVPSAPYVPSASSPSAPYELGTEPSASSAPSAPSAPYVPTAMATTVPPNAPYVTATATVVSATNQPYVPGAHSTPYVPGTAKNSGNECVVCMNEPRSHVAVPCGHKCIGENCSRFFGIGSTCPLCVQPIQMTVKVHDS